MEQAKTLNNTLVHFPSFVSQEEFERYNAWGLHAVINLKHANPSYIRDAERIKRFLIELSDLIEMKRYGDPWVERFGEGDKAGITGVQLIETSNIMAHFADELNAVYLDIFSCKWYDQEKAINFSKDYFEAKEADYSILLRLKP